MYKKYVDPNFTWKNFTIEEQAEILASERSNNYLDTMYIDEYIDIFEIKESIRIYISSIINYLEIKK